MPRQEAALNISTRQPDSHVAELGQVDACQDRDDGEKWHRCGEGKLDRTGIKDGTVTPTVLDAHFGRRSGRSVEIKQTPHLSLSPGSNRIHFIRSGPPQTPLAWTWWAVPVPLPGSTGQAVAGLAGGFSA